MHVRLCDYNRKVSSEGCPSKCFMRFISESSIFHNLSPLCCSKSNSSMPMPRCAFQEPPFILACRYGRWAFLRHRCSSPPGDVQYHVIRLSSTSWLHMLNQPITNPGPRTCGDSTLTHQVLKHVPSTKVSCFHLNLSVDMALISRRIKMVFETTSR